MKSYRVYKQEGLLALKKRLDNIIFFNTSKEVATEPFLHTNLGSFFKASKLSERRSTLFSDWHLAHICNFVDRNRLPQITISAVVYNSDKNLINFINSILNQSYPIKKINLYFVDHGSSDSTLDIIKKFKKEKSRYFLSVELFSRPNNGYGCGNDYAIRKSRDEFCLVSNVDVEFFNDTLINVVNRAITDDENIACWEVCQTPYEHPKYYDPVTLKVEWCSHACILMKRSAYLEVGGYEKQIFMYGEDVELSYRFRNSGYELRYVPSARIFHDVDLENVDVRPHQFIGTVASNILIRYRYGTADDKKEGEELLKMLISLDPRRDEISKIVVEVINNKSHFSDSYPLNEMVHFSFNSFDYCITRLGHDVKITPIATDNPLPLVSIVTRTHGPKVSYLQEAIVSVLNQTYPNIEHIIVEDRTDYAKDLVEKVQGSYGKKVHYLKSDGEGRSRAGNVGLAAAKGRYLMFLDNDDLLFSNHVEHLVKNLMEHPDKLASYALGWEVITEEVENAYNELYHNTPDSHRQPFSQKRLREANFIPIQCILFSREAYDKSGGLSEDLDHLEDWEIWARYSSLGSFHFTPVITSMYRTPSDDNIRKDRQKELDSAYKKVHKIINNREKKLKAMK